jgi:Putative prokaryotic signal transducing protein
MVPLLSASTPMEARIIAARLGAEGIMWELRGSVDGPYPLGPIDVLVDEDGYESARELLLADEIESSFDDGARSASAAAGAAAATGWRDVMWLVGIIAVLVLFAFARMLGHG